MQQLFLYIFSAPTSWGDTNCAGVFAPNGRQLFQHRLSGGHERRQRVRPFRAESFPLRFSGGIRRLRTGGASRHPPRGQKGRDNLRFSFLFELLPFPCFLIWRRFPICDRSEKENDRGFFLCYGRTTFGVRPLEQPVRSVRYHSATHTVYSTQARHKVNCP